MKRAVILGIVTLLLVAANESWALSAGDILIADGNERLPNSVFVVDPVTGDRTVLSDSVTGTGRTLEGIRGITVDAMGYILVTDSIRDAIFEIDDVTGDRVVLSGDPGGANVGSGPAFRQPRAITRYNGSILVPDKSANALFKVDPVTGDRTILSNSVTGTGPNFFDPQGVAVNALGQIFVTDSSRDAVFLVDPITGDRTILSNSANGIGPNFRHPLLVALDPIGNLLVTDRDLSAVFLVDPITGDRSIVSDSVTGVGRDFDEPRGITMGLLGQILVTEQTATGSSTIPAVFLVDPLTGDRTVLSDPTHGIGPDFLRPYDIAVVPEQEVPPIPEPLTTTLGGLGLAALALTLRRRRLA